MLKKYDGKHMKKLLLIFTLIFIALLGASMVSASTNADNLNAVELKNVDNVTIEPIAEDKNVGNVSIEPNEDDSNSVGNEINANEGMTNSSEIGKDFDGDSKSESNQTNIIKEKLASETNVSATKLDIKGPKIGVPLDIPGPKFSFDDLQAEINKAAAESTLTLHCDYKGKENSRIQLNKDLTIEGNGYTIDCAGQSGCSAFYSNSGNIILKNLIIINGHNSDTEKGGAIYINGSAQYTIDHCTFKNNWAEDYGGAIYNDVDKPLTIKNSQFISNGVDDNNGGAIWSCGIVKIDNSLFDSNHANEDGGAIYCKNDVYTNASTFTNNKVKPRDWSWYEYIYHWVDNPNCYGGAICCDKTVYVDNSTFKDNYADDYGRAISETSVKINTKQDNNNEVNSFFINNHAKDNDGGAIYSKNMVTAISTLFEGNHALVDGGGIYACEEVYIDRCIFNSNKAEGAQSQCYGGAIKSGKDVYVDNSTFKDNYAYDYGGAIYAKNVKINTKQDKDSEAKTYFINNHAKDNDGGAVYAEDGVTAKNALFDGNSALVDGAAIYAGSDVHIGKCIFNSNKAEGAKSQCYGGAIRSKGTVYIDNSTFKKNHAEDYGGAVYAKYIEINANQGNKETINTFFDDNSAGNNKGGALFIDNDVIVKNARFSGNKACDCGGGIYSGGVVNANHTEFLGNSALEGSNTNGGGIYSKSGVNVENCTFKDNFANSFGPAIYCIKNINANMNSKGENYRSYFINNTVMSKTNMDQIVCDKDHGKIKYQNADFTS